MYAQQTDQSVPETTDVVVDRFGALGEAVTHASGSGMALEGPHVLWLVAHGAMDVFAVDAGGQGHWHFLGRLEAGTLLLGPVAGPRHTLVGRPVRGGVLRRIPLRELFPQPAQPQPAQPPHGGGGFGAYDAYDALGPLDDAFARGVGRGLRVLFEAPLDGEPGYPGHSGDQGPATDDDILWMPVAPGSVRYGAAYSAEAAADLLIDGAMWQRMVDQLARLLYTLDRWIERLERAHEDRTAAGMEAGETVRAEADEALLAAIDKSGRGGDAGQDSDDSALAVCRAVAEAAGVTLRLPPEGLSSRDRMDPVERLALTSGLRTRPVKLSGDWWKENTGPLVGHRAASGAPVALLWRRGRYEAVQPGSGSRWRIGKANAATLAPRAVMFYRPLPEQPLPARRLLRFALYGARGDLLTLVLSGLVAVGLGALVPVATGQVLGTYVPNAEKGLIAQAAAALVGTAVVAAAFMLLQNTALLRLEGRIESTLQPAVWDRLLRLPTRFFAERSTGELASAAMGVSAIRRVLSGISSIVVQSGTVAAVNLVLLLAYSVPLALTALGVLALVAAIFAATGLWQLRWQRRLVELNNKLNNQAFQTLRGLPKLRVAAAESFAYAAWAKEFARSRELQRRAGRIRNISTVVNAVYLPLATLLLFVLLAGPARGALSPSGFLTFTTAMTMLLTSVTQLTNALISCAAVLPMYEQIKPVLQELPEVRGGSVQPGTLSGAIEARELTFRYSEDGPLVLDGVSFRVEPGEFVAIVGASGCGKSTLLRLLIGFDRPTSGEVRYDGQDLTALDQVAVRRQCGVVLQNAQPHAGSILECVCGAETFPLEEVWEAARMAGVADDIKAMPMGLHTMLSDGGGTVSGGQRQRLMIAQALVRRPRLLFFDEATSALDNETQRVVAESTRELRATRVVIAHRLSTVLDADRVIVMSQGRVVQEGTPAALLADPTGLFHELVRRQR
ncbi:NHLP bacteriocin export ABC transporter permease/ATPase subunit [Streptomyces sp. NBC_01775]|uniref:NHLP bacteriocin export ABC transporter permease/ATPase subunit n=1 Tax=Streptomyces sp. NBC_01775 TaxID=2975939 RepID=UPI002DDC84FE|nr:NHLP bacteriocin export ABC transporter permease/ATPase subunit [Streptomyces sp. NBC_01775]WSB80480.1 NHLP bacteriocin export ABC transporter permease/ATPase subunit [Streptomyces sp. NBC_01775]